LKIAAMTQYELFGDLNPTLSFDSMSETQIIKSLGMAEHRVSLIGE
jgi:hypothetical protein